MIAMSPVGVDMRRLRYFLDVCEHGGFSRAAVAIGIAQPALTRQIKLLENDIGAALFIRNGRNAVPTEIGAYLLRHVRQHMGELEEVIRRVREELLGPPVRVTLGVCPTIAPLFFPALHDAVRKQSPAIELSVIQAYSGDLRSLLSAGSIDLSLSYMPSETTGLAVTPLLTERLVMAAPPPVPEAELSLADLTGLRLILPSRIHQLRRLIDRAAERNGIRLSPALEIDSLNSVKTMLSDRRGGYATVLPCNSVSTEAEEGSLGICFIRDEGMQRVITLIRDRSGPDCPDSLTGLIEARARDIRRNGQGFL
ncbi:HTH-type transcriptional regulator CynR [Paracoccus haematequi]|uniref:HTH-type transcriptional regulator CynR n=1 Tax=Paracoccus haematequi TaxID=2491866 RepID=A0A3S5D3W8_9RHOB|nr:LysR family transcriptional regulator [Paracoccus haematequi]VDS07877.1 HTH-type transcriptional regulator CynR [Paracoccus haematequi]